MSQSTTLWSDSIGRTTADKTHMGTYLTYEEIDQETGIWYPVQRVLIPTAQYKNFAKFLTK